MAESHRSSPGDAASGERDELLATKLNVPWTRHGHLGRPRLVEGLDAGMTQGVILVCTPAGFGKTTLLADWAERARWPVAWLSLDREDSDPVRFWRHVAVALDRACDGLAEHLLPLLGAPGAGSSQRVVTALVNELAAAGDDLALVLDDYHLVASQQVHDAMAYLLSHLPPRLHLIISGRSDPPLSLARLRAAGRLAEFGAAELRFTPEESATLLRDVWDLDLAPEAALALAARAEGWAVGLQLAALSLRERPDPNALLAAFTGTHRYVLDYLSEEVLERQPERVRRFLLRCSVLRRLTGPLCDAVTGGSDGQEMLEEIERANLFLFPLDEQRRWYRFHQLFGELLRARLHRDEAGQVPELHRRAATWCERHRLVDEAIHHASASGDAVWAVRLVEQHVDEVLGRGESVILDGWLAALPDEVVQARPALRFAQGELQFHLGRLGAAERFLAQAERALHHAAGQRELPAPTHAGMVAALPAAIALLRAELAGARGDPEAMAGYARSALALMAQEHGPRLWARWLSGAGADWMRGRLADAESGAAAMLAEGRAASDQYPLITSCFPLASVQRERGRLGAALRTYRQSLRRATEPGRVSPFHAAEAHLGIAQVLYERDQLDDALRHVTESIELGRQVVWFFEPGRRLVMLAWIHQAKGDEEAALEAMNEACRLHQTPEVNSRWNPAPCERARLLLVQGRVEQAARWIEERGLTDRDAVSYPREPDHLVLARVLLARGDPAGALRLLSRLDERAESQGHTESLIRVRALRSLALRSAGDHPGALAVLADALSVAQPEGYVRIFADEGPPMAALLRSLVGARQRGRTAGLSGATHEHLNRVVRAFGHSVGHARKAAVAVPGSIDLLTGREFEVLGFIAAGRRNQDIALELGVTSETVKTHVSNILGKLGAASRTQAVARARELGLIA
jgi:LuxR family maltose regulon positive regulatory protein